MEKMLNILEQNHVNASFFIIGNAALYDLGPDLLKRAVNDGDEIAYHSMKHDQDAIKTWTIDDWSKDYESWTQEMKTLLGDRLYAKGVKNYARPPGGLFDGAFLAMTRKYGLIPFGWNTSPEYWKSGVKPHGGDILLIHVTYDDVSKLEDLLKMDNFRPVTATNLIEESIKNK